MERIIYQAPSHHDPSDQIRTNLKKLPHVKLAPGEQIICIQRQHWIILAGRMIFPILVFSVVPIILLLIPTELFTPIFPNIALLQIFFLLGSLIAILLIETYIFMDWYYLFYIITTRCLLLMHFFRIGGYYFDEVFLDKINQLEISRSAQNFIYDLLDLNDVTITFSKIERPEPFVFRTPSDSSLIEDIIEDITIKEIENKEVKR